MVLCLWLFLLDRMYEDATVLATFHSLVQPFREQPLRIFEKDSALRPTIHTYTGGRFILSIAEISL